MSHPDGRGLTPAQASARDALMEVVRQDDTMFGGWYKRHGGVIVFFGDHFGSTDWTSALMVIGAAVFLWIMFRHSPPVAAVVVPVAAAKAAAVGAKAARRRKG